MLPYMEGGVEKDFEGVMKLKLLGMGRLSLLIYKCDHKGPLRERQKGSGEGNVIMEAATGVARSQGLLAAA